MTQQRVGELKTLQSNAKDLQIKSDFTMIQEGLNLYKTNNGVYPLTLQELSIGKTIYISSLPTSPYKGSTYEYQSDVNTYTLSTKLGNGTVYRVSK